MFMFLVSEVSFVSIVSLLKSIFCQTSICFCCGGGEGHGDQADQRAAGPPDSNDGVQDQDGRAGRYPSQEQVLSHKAVGGYKVWKKCVRDL